MYRYVLLPHLIIIHYLIAVFQEGIPVIEPLQIRLQIPDNLGVHYPTLSSQEVEDLKAELSREHERYLALVKDVDLVKFWNLGRA